MAAVISVRNLIKTYTLGGFFGGIKAFAESQKSFRAAVVGKSTTRKAESAAR